MKMLKYQRLYYKQFLLLPKGSYRFLSLIQYYHVWKKSIQPGKSTLTDGMPWMTFDAIAFLRRNISKSMRVFEYGSGGSSVFFSQLAGEIISVDHDREWFSLVEENIKKRGIKNWKGILAEAEVNQLPIERDASNPDEYGSSDKLNRRNSFEKYVKTIDQFPDGHFDLVVIDGRSRPSCVKHSISKVKSGGFILLDNADRANYADAIAGFLTFNMHLELDTFGPTSHNPEFTITKIWKKV